MARYKYRLGNGLAFSEGKDVQIMESMARKGYAPVGANTLGFYRFEAAPPEDVLYTVDFSNISPCCDDFEDYKEIFHSGGWAHVFSVGCCHWFKAPKGTTPIYTDRPSEADKHRNMFLFSRQVAICALLAALGFAVFFGVGAVLENRVMRMAAGILFGATFGPGVVMLFGAVLNWRRMAKMK